MQLSHLSGLIGYLDLEAKNQAIGNWVAPFCLVHLQMTVGICSVAHLIRQEP